MTTKTHKNHTHAPDKSEPTNPCPTTQPDQDIARITDAILGYAKPGSKSPPVASPVTVIIEMEAVSPQNEVGHSYQWVPVTLAEAQEMWQKLQAAAAKTLEHRSDGLEALWIVGRHGGEPLGVGLVQGGRICSTLLPCEAWEWAILPKARCRAGSRSLYAALNSCFPTNSAGDMHCPPEFQSGWNEALRSFYLNNATRPLAASKPISDYDAAKRTMTLSSAESLATEAFKLALRAARPQDIDSFANQWAVAALDYVTDQPSHPALLAPEGITRLELIRSRNVHKTVQDLQSQHRELERQLGYERACLAKDMEAMQAHFVDRSDNELHHLFAREASYQTVAASMKQEKANLKPFSQRFIKGMVIAKASGATLFIGHLSDALSQPLGALYGDALLDMQEAKVILNKKNIPELWLGPAQGHAAGKFCLSDRNGLWLDAPHIYLAAEIMMSDHRSVFHEFRHARQELACLGPLPHFSDAKYEAMPTEADAKMAEANMIAHFGILF